MWGAWTQRAPESRPPSGWFSWEQARDWPGAGPWHRLWLDEGQGQGPHWAPGRRLRAGLAPPQGVFAGTRSDRRSAAACWRSTALAGARSTELGAPARRRAAGPGPTCCASAAARGSSRDLRLLRKGLVGACVCGLSGPPTGEGGETARPSLPTSVSTAFRARPGAGFVGDGPEESRPSARRPGPFARCPPPRALRAWLSRAEPGRRDEGRGEGRGAALRGWPVSPRPGHGGGAARTTAAGAGRGGGQVGGAL